MNGVIVAYILELIARARLIDLYIKTYEPVAELPDTLALLGMPMDPDLAALYRTTNGCEIESLYVYGTCDVRDDIIGMNDSARNLRDDDLILREVLLCAGFGYQATELATVPINADEQGRHPVVIMDTNEEAYILPIASTLNRALELVVDNEIRKKTDEDVEFDEPFPLNRASVKRIAKDTRLMSLIDANSFAALGGEIDFTHEWYDILRDAARRSE